MRQIAIGLILALFIVAQGTAEASSFQISFGYGDRDDGGWAVTHRKNERYTAGRYNTRYPVYTASPWPQAYFLDYVYAPKARQCYMATDKYGRKFRKCVWVRDSGYECRDGCDVKHDSGYHAGWYGQAGRYCRYK